MSTRYTVSGEQGAAEPGSKGAVLANKLHITSAEEMDEVELVLLEKLYEAVLVEHLPQRPIVPDDLVTWHRQWLGNVYSWAGESRSVNTTQGRLHVCGRRADSAIAA